MSRWRCLGFAVFVCLSASRADAVPIGVFSWAGDDLFGPLFTVENFSDDAGQSLGLPGGAFSDVFVDLVFGDGTAPLSLMLASIVEPGDETIDPGEIAQNFALPTSFDIGSAALRLALPFEGTIGLIDAGGTPIESLTQANSAALIDFTPVPEPSTLLLVGVGLASARLMRRK